MPAIRKSVQQKDGCAAVDRWNERCTRIRAAGEERWCHTHVVEQHKLYKDYKVACEFIRGSLIGAESYVKRCTGELETFPEIEATKDPSLIHACASISELKEWHHTIRLRYVLASRAIDARLYHHEHFFAADVDFGHRKFIENLKKDRKICELALSQIEKKAHELILQASSASFVLEDDEQRFPRPTDENDCIPQEPASHGHGHGGHKHAHKAKIQDSSDGDDDKIENPLDVAYNERRNQLIHELGEYCHFACGYDDPLLAHERKLIYDAVIRDVIIRDPALALVAQGYGDIHNFLCHSSELDVQSLSRLARSLELHKNDLRTLGLRENKMRDATQNALFRKPEDVPEKEKCWFLGGWVYQYPSKEDMPRRAWDHMYAFFKCHMCLVSCTHSLAELLRNRRYALAPYHNPRYRNWANHDQSTAGHALRGLGILVGEENKTVSRSVYKQDGATRMRHAVWTEKQDRAWMYFKVHIDEPWTLKFLQDLSECYKDEKFRLRVFDIVVRDGRHHNRRQKTKCACNPIVYKSPDLWVTRYRSGATQSALRTAKWENDYSFDEDSFDDAESPEHSWNLDFSGDAYEVYVLDASPTPGKTSMDAFKWDIAYVALRAQGMDANDYKEIFRRLTAQAEREDQEWKDSVDISKLDLSWRCPADKQGEDAKDAEYRANKAKYWESHCFKECRGNCSACLRELGLRS